MPQVSLEEMLDDLHLDDAEMDDWEDVEEDENDQNDMDMQTR